LATGAARLIEEKYIENGQVRYEYYYVTFNQPAGKLAAEAAECANSQSKFWPYHDILYANQTGSSDQYSERRLLAFARELKLDVGEFRSCLRDGHSRGVVQDDVDLASQMGVQATPTLFINGEKVEGAQSFDVYREVIERKLAQDKS